MAGLALDDRLLPQIGLLKGRDGKIDRISHLPEDFVMGRGQVRDGDGLHLPVRQITVEKLIVDVHGLLTLPERLIVLGDLRVLDSFWEEPVRLKYLRVDGQLRICSGLLVDLARAVWFETAEIDLRGDLLVEAPHVWLHPHINRERPPDWSAGEFVPTPRFRWNLETVSRVVKGRIVIGRERWGFSLYDPATDSFEDRPWPLPRVKEPVGQG